MVGRFGPDGQLAGLRLADDLHAGHLRGERRLEHVEPLPLGRRDRVDLQLARLFQRRVGLEFRDRRLDGLLVLGRGHDHQTLVFRIERDLGGGDQLLEDGEQVGRRLLHERVEAQDGHLRCVGLELLDRRLDRVVVLRRGHGHQPAVLRVDRDLGLGNELREDRRQVGRWVLLEGVEAERGCIRAGRGRLELVERVLDDRVLVGQGQRHQVARLRLDTQLSVRHQGLKQRERRGGIERSQRVDDQVRLGVGRGFLELLDGRLDRFMVGGRSQHGQSFLFRVDRDLRLGRQIL